MHLIKSKEVLAGFFNRDPVLYVYALADLDDHLFSDCEFFGNSAHPDELRVIFLRYNGMRPPCIVAHAPEDAEAGREILGNICQTSSGDLYGLIQEDLVPAFLPTHVIVRSAREQRMFLSDRRLAPLVQCQQSIQLLTLDHAVAVRELIDLSTFESWFEESTLRYRQSWGVFVGARLVAITGTHVFSERYGVAAIGNVITHPEFRGQGFATALVAHQCRQFPASIMTIGLNVQENNTAAVKAYKKVGFQLHSVFLEIFASPFANRN